MKANEQIREVGGNNLSVSDDDASYTRSNPDGQLGDSNTRWLTFEATAYIALCDTGCTGITATGIDVRGASTYEGKRIIAVDPAVVPLWSEVELRYADGRIERAIALDTGGDIKNSRIDLLVADIDTAWAFGRQPVELRILNEGKR